MRLSKIPMYLQRPECLDKEDARLRYMMCDALTDCLVMLGYSKCPTARRNKSGYRETKKDISSAHAGTGPENIYGEWFCNKDMADGA